MKSEVKLICPRCGKEWTEVQYTADEWYKLATRQILCDECGKVVIDEIKERMFSNVHE